MSELKFKLLKESEAPKPFMSRVNKSSYNPLFNALENMDTDEVLLITFEDQRHYHRIGSAVRSYFGSGAFAFRRVEKPTWKFIIKHVKKGDKNE